MQFTTAEVALAGIGATVLTGYLAHRRDVVRLRHERSLEAGRWRREDVIYWRDERRRTSSEFLGVASRQSRTASAALQVLEEESSTLSMPEMLELYRAPTKSIDWPMLMDRSVNRLEIMADLSLQLVKGMGEAMTAWSSMRLVASASSRKESASLLEALLTLSLAVGSCLAERSMGTEHSRTNAYQPVFADLPEWAHRAGVSDVVARLHVAGPAPSIQDAKALIEACHNARQVWLDAVQDDIGST